MLLKDTWFGSAKEALSKEANHVYKGSEKRLRWNCFWTIFLQPKEVSNHVALLNR